MAMLCAHFNSRYTIAQKVWQGRICFYSGLPLYPEKSYKINFGNLVEKSFRVDACLQIYWKRSLLVINA